MKEFSSEAFFDLSSFQHSALFKNLTFVWVALTLIENYLSSLRLGNIEIMVPEGAYLIDKHLITIGKGSIIEPGAYLKGPCVIGKNCVIRHGAYVRGNVVTGDHCVIGHDTEIKNSILLNHAHAAHFAYVGDSILGNNVNLGAGTKCANLKFDKQSIKIQFQNTIIDSGLRKFGAIFGDNVQTGCNSVTNPGTILGKGTLCSPSTNIKGVIPAHSFVKSNTKLIIESQDGVL